MLDCDGQEGLESLRLASREYGNLADTLAVATSKGGGHLYFSWPVNAVVRNVVKVLPGIDVRGEGGYVIVPPSIHPCGMRYEWLGGRESQPIIAAPDWLLGLVLREPVQGLNLGKFETLAIQ